MPHWACHYYRIETNSTFIVGSWSFSVADSIAALFVYGGLIALNLLSISFERFRFASALLTGVLHLFIGSLHLYRLLHPFTFEVFGYAWSTGASIREVLVIIPTGLLALYVAIAIKREGTAK